MLGACGVFAADVAAKPEAAVGRLGGDRCSADGAAAGGTRPRLLDLALARHGSRTAGLCRLAAWAWLTCIRSVSLCSASDQRQTMVKWRLSALDFPARLTAVNTAR